MSKEAREKFPHREIYRRPSPDNKDAFYQPHVFVTHDGAIGIACNGKVAVKTIESWMDLSWQNGEVKPLPSEENNANNKDIMTKLREDAKEQLESYERIANAIGNNIFNEIDLKTMQAYLMLQLLDKLEGIDDNLTVLTQNSNDEWYERHNR